MLKHKIIHMSFAFNDRFINTWCKVLIGLSKSFITGLYNIVWLVRLHSSLTATVYTLFPRAFERALKSYHFRGSSNDSLLVRLTLRIPVFSEFPRIKKMPSAGLYSSVKRKTSGSLSTVSRYFGMFNFGIEREPDGEVDVHSVLPLVYGASPTSIYQCTTGCARVRVRPEILNLT